MRFCDHHNYGSMCAFAIKEHARHGGILGVLYVYTIIILQVALGAACDYCIVPLSLSLSF